MTPGRMRVARYYGPGQDLKLEDAPLPRLEQGEVLLRVRAAGVCHTELHLLDGVLNPGVTPLVPGHEVVGEVVAARGAGQRRPGERVLLYYFAPCGACRYCRSGHEQLCPFMARQFGFTADGGYAEYMAAPATSLLLLPDRLADQDAVGLACGGATALHASSVAEVRLGETVVVYGIGGVGLYLVQVCRLMGARVIAVGRTPEKLALAADLGAELCVDARENDPVAAVREATKGDGADVVFDLVASRATMQNGARMLARRGRLVFTGYGRDALALNPLLLVLREIQLRGAMGNTLAELAATIDLAARGELRSAASALYPLDEVNEAVAALRAGRVVGRAVLVPEPTGSVREALAHRAPNQAASRAARDAPYNIGTPVADVPKKAQHQQASDARPIPLAPRPGPRPFESELLAVIAGGIDQPLSDDEFDSLALGLFAYQYATNEPYRLFCQSQARTPTDVARWTEIPAVPIAAFKEVALACEGTEQTAALFMSSGTTRPEERSRHYHPDLAVYDACIRANFAPHVVPDGASLPFLVLNPPPAAQPHSSLAYYLGSMLGTYGAPGSDYFIDDTGFQRPRLLERLATATEPVCLLGTTFAFVHLLDSLAEAEVHLTLPDGSRAFDTGGIKGRSREVGRDELERSITSHLGIPLEYQVNMYGLTELSTQFIDANLRLLTRRLPPRRYKTVAPWARTRVLDPVSLDPLPPGEVGVLCHTDLANRASVCTVLTEDLGVLRDEGFEMLGRAQGSQARGCSIAMDELLAATGRTR